VNAGVLDFDRLGFHRVGRAIKNAILAEPLGAHKEVDDADWNSRSEAVMMN